MCGIVGALGECSDVVRTILPMLAHRGPDNLGIWEHDDLSFGHARLSIIDLSEAANQPMVDDETGSCITFNGEIYNYIELRIKLEKQGIRFMTESDTEVVLKGVVKNGIDFINQLNGVYAFSIYLAKSDDVIIARDPMGVKPLYIWEGAGEFAFASEAKALYSLPPSLQISRAALSSYLRFHYVTGDHTMLRGINRFPAGKVWQINRRTLLKTESNINFVGLNPTIRGGSPAQLLQTLDDAVKRQLVADVPIGAFLSGGIDSSIICALASKHLDAPLQTFSVGFDSGLHDERGDAAKFAEIIESDHQDILISGDQVAQELPDMSWHYDGPLGEAGCIPTWFVSREAAKQVKVVLAGEGSDELLGGYPWYARHLKLERVSRFIPKSASLSKIAEHIPGQIGKISRALASSKLPERYAPWVENFTPSDIASFNIGQAHLIDEPAADCMEIDQKSLLKNCFLIKADKMTMAHGLEERVPFLDLEFADFARAVNLTDKIGPPEKRILRDAASNLPTELRYRKKRGYGTPAHAWLNGELADREAQMMDEPAGISHDWISRDKWGLVTKASRKSPAKRWLVFALDIWLDEICQRMPNSNVTQLQN